VMRPLTRHRPLAKGLSIAVAALAASVPAPAAAAAQERPASDEAAQRAVDDDRGRARKRVLTLRDGQTVRALARSSDGRWEYKVDGRWRALPADAVVRDRLEKDLLSEMKALALELESSPDSNRRVALCEWMITNGLKAEALQDLDRVLAQEPHQPAALALLARRPLVAVPSVDVPAGEVEAARDELVTWGAQAPTAARELALNELGRLADRDALREELERQLRHGSLRRRSFAAHALGRLFPGQEVKNLLMHAVLDPSEEVRRSSSHALAAAGTPAVVVPVVRALNSADERVRLQAAESLGNAGYAAAVEPLMGHLAAVTAQAGGTRRVNHGNIFVGRQFAYIQDFDVEVAQFQAVADPQVNVLIEGDVLDAGVHSVGRFDFAYQSKVVRRSLQQLTGESPGHTARDWMRWWEQNASAWRAADHSRAGE